MANIEIKDGAGSSKYVSATGAGSGGDPFIPSHAISSMPNVDIDTMPTISGTVVVSSMPTVTLNALPAGTNLVGVVVAGLSTASIYNATAALVPKFAKIDVTTSGNNTIVAAVSGKKIRVLNAFLVSAGTVATRFESGADGTALTGQMALVVNTGFVLPFNPVGWFETTSGVLLNLELSDALSVDGCLTYVEV